MNLHEYQSKALFTQYGIAVPENRVINDPSQVKTNLQELGGDRWVVKAQVHAGGRGKAGGVKIADKTEDVEQFVSSMLGKNLVTFQTDATGQPVNQILIEQPCDIERELYLGAVIDRARRQIVFMASTEGGVEIEKVAAETPEKILKAAVNPVVGLQGYQCRDLAFGLGLQGDQIKQFGQLLSSLAKMFVEKDLSLLEINPLVVTSQGDLLCLDAKINIDDNALYRHKELEELRDITQEDEREVRASKWDLNYISLEGEIGCMVNGAGLAMATMDLIKLHGAEPANFLDVGGTATKERVAEAFKIILSDDNVKGVLVNIFGGIVRCDMIAEG
ncbi:MAG: ADP-forming succinate--CoA ligase subunit beta, partial [Gammaproteobacteria bacterium]|nr:ADP-forming succinate--CoA ligase subunit beta [Gammaproteobacteria bacterium]